MLKGHSSRLFVNKNRLGLVPKGSFSCDQQKIQIHWEGIYGKKES